MNGWFNPDNYLDLISQTLLIIGGLAIAVVPSWFAARNRKAITSVYDSINNRPTTIRDDIDALRSDVGGIRDEMRGGFDAVRSDAAEERAARRAGDNAIRDEINRHHPPAA